jgi:YHS domain-containing protein
MRRLATLLAAALLAVTATSAVAKEGKPSPAALQGYCPVAYVEMGKAVKGDPQVSVVKNGHRYLFASADARKMFLMAPAKYDVGYDGWCATAVSMGQKVKSDPALFTVHGGRTYLFSNAEAKQAFDAMPEAVIGKADAQWAAWAKKK